MLKKVSKKLSVVLLMVMLITSSVNAFTTEEYVWQNVKTGTGGGFVPGIIFNTSEENLIYTRTDIGGAYRWDQMNESWIPLTDWVGFVDWNKNGVDALATDPIDTNRVYMAVGTYTNDWDTNGHILRSTDKGDTWESTPLPFKVGGNMPGRSMGERLMIDPNDNSIIYFGARSGNGLWKSTDYGVTWSKVTSFTQTGTYIPRPGQEYGGDPTGIAWITFDPSTGTLGNATQTIYVGVADQGNCIFRSTDAGVTWEAIPGQPIGYLPHHGVLSSTGKLYISYSDGCGPYDGSKGDVWKFDASGGTWTNISPVPSSSSDNHYGYGGLAVDAQSPNTIMVATLNAWWPDEIIFRSTDGGSTWTRIWDFGVYPNRINRYTHDISAAPWLTFNSQAQLPEVTPKLGWMIGDLEIDPFNSNRMMYGTGATIYGTDNLNNWDSGTINIEVKGVGMEETAVLSVISPPSGAHLLSGLGDIGGFRHDDITQVPSMMYTSPLFLTTTSMDYAELDPNIIVRVGNVDRQYSTNKASGFSNDGGTSWFEGATEPNGTTTGGMTAIAADGSSVVWSPNGTASVCYSTDNGVSWTACSGLPAQSSVASDRVNPDKFYGFSAGDFYVSTDGGVSFTKTPATGLPVAASILHSSPESGATQFKAMPGVEGDIWFVGGDKDGEHGIWHSTDSGQSFTKLSNVQEADVIGFGKAANGQNYMALYTSAKIDGVRGIFRSIDAGSSWVRINDDLHQYARTNMCISGDPRIYGRVYLGTNGRGVVYGDTAITSPTPAPTTTSAPTATPTPTPNPLAGDIK
ncbi:WD40/YVTN/BNR-like repeat-containing protein [Vallitalea pronyensis]|uniref:WD40/YVTN/BNR-like repeat-containing protein n=1 Tax=Vallitalea pronyensis TaxID=1348613 RepID=UPI001BAF589D|nr:sialidase family protein [Vallitalea pronyensis]